MRVKARVKVGVKNKTPARHNDVQALDSQYLLIQKIIIPVLLLRLEVPFLR